MILKILATTGRLCSVVFGLSLFLWLGPQTTPGQPANLEVVGVNGILEFSIRLPHLADPLFASIPIVVIATALLLAASILLNFPLSRFKGPLHFEGIGVPGVIAVILFLSGVLPPDFRFVGTPSLVALVFLLHLSSFLLVWHGLAPLLRRYSSPESLGPQIEAVLRTVKHLFLFSPAVVTVGIMMTCTLLLGVWISGEVFGYLPHVQDSISQLFQAKIFATGHLTAPPPPLPEFFEFLQIIIGDRWYSMYPPGHPLLLSLGVLVGIPWIVNPLFGSLTVGLLYLVGKELYGDIVGRISALLGLLSPFLVFMSSEFMNHTTALFFFLAFIFFVARSRRTGRIRDGILAGLSLGSVCLIRPYSAAALALPFFAGGAVWILKGRPVSWKSVAGFMVSLSGLVGILLLYNFATNGHPFLFGFEVRWGPQVNPGFGTTNAGQIHTPLKGLFQTMNNMIGLNKYLFEWPVPSLLLVLILFLRRRVPLRDILLGGSLLSVAGAYAFYWFQDWCFGPRFYFEAGGLMIILTARSLYELPVFFPHTPVAVVRRATMTALAGLFIAGYAANIPPHLRFYSDRYWGVDAEIARTAKEVISQEAIVFVGDSYESVFSLNDPNLRGAVYARDLGELNGRLVDRLPGRAVYYLDRSGIRLVRPAGEAVR